MPYAFNLGNVPSVERLKGDLKDAIFQDGGFVSTQRSGEDKSRDYTKTRGILMRKEDAYAKVIDMNKGYRFQFNPETVQDNKMTNYEVRSYTGLPYNDYIWTGGGERLVSFQLFLDNTPQSKGTQFRPTEYNSKLALTLDPTQQGIRYASGNAWSTTRVSARGILDEVEFLMSFLYPDRLTGEREVPKFASGGVVSRNQFRPPAQAVLALGPLYYEGYVKSLPVDYTLFDEDLTPIRATVNVEFSVSEIIAVSNPLNN